uniref:(northern house mosquito) hypothetical protein n=1 Tax=Culex pipiens TaxID=7175 RepID=A0A8D8JD95_CULPI
MRHGAREDLAHGALLLCPVRPAVWRGRIPRARRQAVLPQRLLRHVRAQVQRVQPGHHGELHFRAQQPVASGLFRVQGLPSALLRGFVLRPRGSAVLRDPLPRQAGIAVRGLLQAHHRTVHHGHV